jgi:hypothetical protein
MQPKEPPPSNEDRTTVDPDPPGVDPERTAARPKKPEDGAEADASPEAEVASHSE